MRKISDIEKELEEARAALRGMFPTHARVARCERLFIELEAAKQAKFGMKAVLPND